jgi:hypothetical protein
LHRFISTAHHQKEEREGGRRITHRRNIVRKLMQLS